jgi:hypothetical protein
MRAFKRPFLLSWNTWSQKRIKNLITENNVEFSLSIFIEYDYWDEIKNQFWLWKRNSVVNNNFCCKHFLLVKILFIIFQFGGRNVIWIYSFISNMKNCVKYIVCFYVNQTYETVFFKKIICYLHKFYLQS